ncbi:MAG: hypothetical protein A2X86_03515 [Bdellovibrionales bacterium GWA2_49_15]|nr:MAG: hypothetical protein A2X86_03515 [Bdellovibrionales bacterium GWA2_49_15]HAZ12284.1 hypothetical protein [Bdellovibrionales bacterium]
MRDFSIRYDLDLKTDLNQNEQNQLEHGLQRILQKCPSGCVARLEATSVRHDICLNLELKGLLMPITAFAIGPVFEEVLSDLEMELAIQLNHGASASANSLVWAV